MFKPTFSKLMLCIVAMVLMTTACKRKDFAKRMDSSIGNYVYAYTSGMLSRYDPIRVQFTGAQISEEEVGGLVENVISFRPKIAGKAVWENDRTIIFQPNESLESGARYVAEVKLDKLFQGIEEKAKLFEFEVQVKEMNFDIEVLSLKTSFKDENKQDLEGILTTTDVVEPQDVQKIVEASQSGNKNVTISWVNSKNKLEHKFTINNLERQKNSSDLNLSWNGRAINVSTKGKEKIEIPAKGEFKLMSAKIKGASKPYIALQFSDAISSTQNLDGLINITGTKGKVKSTIEGNVLKVFPTKRIQGSTQVVVEAGVRNTKGKTLKNTVRWNLNFEEEKPMVRLVGNGVIVPESKGLIFPFEAVNLNMVDVEIVKIFENNILQFLQTNALDGSSNLRRVGRIVLQKQVALTNLNPTANTTEWTRYGLDLAPLIEKDPRAIYQVRLGFRKSYTTYHCSDAKAIEVSNKVTGGSNMTLIANDNMEEEIESFYDDNYYGYDGYYSDYNYRHRKNPCYPAYYSGRNFVARNVVSSNFGIVAKRGTDGSFFIAVSDIRTTEKQAKTKVEFYDYQQQLLKTTTTDSDGIVMTKLKRKPFFVVASRGDQRGYLRLEDGTSLSLSRFDVGGVRPQKGLKGYIYGERGVWRPGDSIYLNFVLEDKNQTLPKNHPVLFEFRDSRGQLQQTYKTSTHLKGVYSFKTATTSDAPTGNWYLTAKVGGASFEKTIQIETIKPNRLKMALDFGVEELSPKDKTLEGDLQVNWLHGAPAQSLKTKVEMQLNAINTTFPKFAEYEFDDPARKIDSDVETIFDKKVDETGKGTVSHKLNVTNASGKLRANFKVRAFENGGDFSVNNFSINYSPYPSYAGVFLPENKYGEKRLEIEQKNEIEFVSVNANNTPNKKQKLTIGVYRIDWRWWWERTDDNVTNFNTTSHLGAVKKDEITTNSRGEAKWNFTPERWGRYLVRVCDTESGHCSGDFFYAGYPWYDNDDGNSRKAAAMLSFKASKEKYKVGETIELNVPAAENSKMLITLENGSGVVETYWKIAEKGDNTIRIQATKEMTPNVYAYVTLVQPHGQNDNDLPIRMYGVTPITIENPKTKLNPIIAMPEVIRPEQKVTVKVSEKNKKPMAYTLAIVDDGLLDLTNFNTPNPWSSFYAKEALGVRTWDLYDNILGAYGSELQRILSIGGGAGANKKGNPTANRFKPVVKHIGPFYLKKGETASHEILMPNYVGSVRTMVVASNEGAYGSGEKTTPVRKPLMVLATLPRVLGPTEKLSLPVNVFAMEKQIKNVTVKVETNDLIKINGSTSKNITFSKIGDQIVNFDLEVGEGVGIAKVKVIATSGKEISTQEIELDVRNPNPYVTDIISDVLEGGKHWEKNFDKVGMTGTNTGVLEVSNIPPLNLGKRLEYLIRYPYGCIEQTTSSGFPQLYVGRLLDLKQDQKDKISNNIIATIDRLKRFVLDDGGFAYWPGNEDVNSWGTNYAGHFLLEAESLGYALPPNWKSRWVKHQTKKAKNWTKNESGERYYRDGSELIQAYRLYGLALAKSPEWGAMNRLRNQKDLSNIAKWRLAAAYALGGKPEVAKTIIGNLTFEVQKYRALSYTYGSDLRDQGMMLETLLAIGKSEQKRAAEVVKLISNKMSSEDWYSTQSLSYALLAVGKFAGENELGEDFKFAYKIAEDKVIEASSNTPVMQVEIPVDELTMNRLRVSNMSNSIMYVRVILTGQPLIGDQTKTSENLNIEVAYKDMKGKSLDPSSIKQGTDFVAEVKVKNPGMKGNYDEMALAQVFPSGWEIHNTRMNTINAFKNSYKPEYQDIRDDRVYTFFDIAKGKEQIYRVQLNAAYEGRYYLPTIACEAMYDNSINARQPGQWVEVTK